MSTTQWIPGVVSATFRKMPLDTDQILQLCTECKLQGIEWSENAHVFPEDQDSARILGQKTRDAGLQIAAYGSYYRLGEQTDIETVFLPKLQAAQALGADIIRVWAGTKASSEVTEDERASLAKEAQVIGKLGENFGIRVAFEWHKNTLTDTNASALQLMQEADQQNLYFLWQPTVALTPKERTDGLSRIQDRLLNIHVYSWPDGKRGPLNAAEWQYYLDAAQDVGGKHFTLLEFVRDDTVEQFRSDCQTLLNLLESGESNG